MACVLKLVAAVEKSFGISDYRVNEPHPSLDRMEDYAV